VANLVRVAGLKRNLALLERHNGDPQGLVPSQGARLDTAREGAIKRQKVMNLSEIPVVAFESRRKQAGSGRQPQGWEAE